MIFYKKILNSLGSGGCLKDDNFIISSKSSRSIKNCEKLNLKVLKSHKVLKEVS